MDAGGTYYNTKAQVSALESLLRKLPGTSAPVRAPRNGRKPGTAKQLGRNQVQELIKCYQDGASLRRLGEQFGISRQAVSNILRREGAEMRQRNLSAEQVDELVRFYERGWSMARIGERLNVDPTTVLNRLRERGVRTRDTQGRER